ncbi:hypothetical protein GCM10027217_25620 [Pseudomaricurvus hydrocarbonicus]
MLIYGIFFCRFKIDMLFVRNYCSIAGAKSGIFADIEILSNLIESKLLTTSTLSVGREQLWLHRQAYIVVDYPMS